MLLGAPTHPRRDPVQEIDWIGRHGFDFVDLFLEPDLGAAETLDCAAVRAALERHGLSVIGHLPWYLPFGTPLARLRNTAVDIAVDYAGVAAEVGADLVTVHADWPLKLFSRGEAILFQAAALAELVRRTRGIGVRILFEPIVTAQDSVDSIERILAAVPELLLHLDVGHANLCGRDPAAMIRHFGERIRHVHLHDNNGASDQHLPPGTGTIDWPGVVAALREIPYRHTITLEVFSTDRDYLLLARDKVRQWFREDTSA